jgi:hypothetical protein
MYDGLKGNKNAEKWPEQDVITLFSELCDKAHKEECYLLIHVLETRVTLSQYEYLKDKFKANKTVSELIKNILSICEANLTRAMLTGKIKETASIFLLKSKYGYIDKQVTEIEHKGSIQINLTMPDEIPDTE